ncbi:hypothetical protein BGZ49_000243 [Haplosporangium sp. Z 27]|nr:hypothetical protein BGZ49_000243 [Haplosporangium sp. Z 27]
MVLVTAAMRITNRLDIEDPLIKKLIFGIYIVSQIVALGTSFLISQRIHQKADTTVLKYTEEPGPLSKEEPKEVTSTVMEYDLKQNSQALNQAFFIFALMMFMHYKSGAVRPLIIQTVLPLKNVFTSNWAKIHLFDRPAVGDLARPWKDEDSLAVFHEITDQFKGGETITAAIGDDIKPKVESKKSI